MKVTVYGQLSGGQIKVNGDYLRAQLRTKKDCDIRLTVESTGTRSNQQNAYWWGVVVPAVCNGLQEVSGETLEPEEAHEFLKEKFVAPGLVVHKETGEVLGIRPRTTTLLSKDEFGALIDNVLKFSAEYLGVVIPLPNEDQSGYFNNF